MPRRLRACLLSFLLLESTLAWPLGLALAGGTAAEAFAQARSSGGYARPGGGYGRTPSFGGGRVAPRTPSTSGGYGRPALPFPDAPRRPSVQAPAGSGWDRGYSQERSAEALDRMRRQLDTARRQREQPMPVPSAPAPSARVPSTQPDPGWWRRGGRPGGGYADDARLGRNGGWYRDRGWAPQGGGWGMPGGIFGGGRSFGVWDGLFLWFLLNNLNRAGSTDFFHNHRDDPGFREWRQDAEQRAQTDPEIRRQLEELDRRLDDRRDQPRDPNYLPPDVPPEVATAPRADARTPSTGASEDPGPGTQGGGAAPSGTGLGGMGGLLILGGIGAFGLLAWRRRQAAAGPAGRGGSGASSGGIPPRAPDFSAAPRFRVGMTLTLDPTPFLLGAGALRVPAPAADGDGRVSVEAVGRIREGREELTRLYLPGSRAFVQIHLDAAGQAEECRYFDILDEVVPADEAEWGVWLDPQQGLIGWPEFETKDGRRHARVWSPGANPVPPRAMVEAVEGLSGTRELRLQSMLYAAPTGAPAPAPPFEYILVSAVEAEGRAWVEIRAGIDINPASLSIA